MCPNRTAAVAGMPLKLMLAQRPKLINGVDATLFMRSQSGNGYMAALEVEAGGRMS